MIPRFRVWEPYYKKMFANDQIIIWDGNVYVNDADKITVDNMKGWSIDDKYLMQSTGLFDNSEPPKEIFEGDVVETIYNGKLFTGVIVYDKDETDFKATNGRNEYGNNFCYLGGNDSNTVIGNIYQNKELAEGRL